MYKLILTVFGVGFLGAVLGCLNMLSDDGRWVVAGILALALVLTIISGIKNKGIIPLIITIATILIGQSSANAQTFEELKVLSSKNTSILQFLTPGNFGPISLYEDEGSMGGWVKIEAPGIYFSSNKEVVTSLEGIETNSPTILGGKINESLYLLLIRTYTQGYIQGENKLYILDSGHNFSREVFIPGYISKVFIKEGLIFVDSHIGEYKTNTLTLLHSILSLKEETINTNIYQKKIISR